MKEVILSIQDMSPLPDEAGCNLDGYCIKTNEQNIYLGIQNWQDCCEDWGYIVAHEQDNLADYIGAELLGISLVDTKLEVTTLPQYVAEGSCMFVNVETSKGTLQFTLYNEHNGYYGHEVRIKSNQLTESECI